MYWSRGHEHETQGMFVQKDVEMILNTFHEMTTMLRNVTDYFINGENFWKEAL
jgi:carboxypeptidase C (cathepsin A)